MPLNKNEQHLHAMELVEAYSKSNHTLSWIWGGYTVDVYENRLLREHDDLDYLTLNLHARLARFTTLFENEGWQTTLLENGDLKAERDSARIQLGHVEFLAKARWTHNGDKGSLWFPREWLISKPVRFCGVEIHVVAPEFQYVLVEHPQLLNPGWIRRAKDNAARNYLKEYIERKGISAQTLFEQVGDGRSQLV
jgi:hypothetical protein